MSYSCPSLDGHDKFVIYPPSSRRSSRPPLDDIASIDSSVTFSRFDNCSTSTASSSTSSSSGVQFFSPSRRNGFGNHDDGLRTIDRVPNDVIHDVKEDDDGDSAVVSVKTTPEIKMIAHETQDFLHSLTSVPLVEQLSLSISLLEETRQDVQQTLGNVGGGGSGGAKLATDDTGRIVLETTQPPADVVAAAYGSDAIGDPIGQQHKQPKTLLAGCVSRDVLDGIVHGRVGDILSMGVCTDSSTCVGGRCSCNSFGIDTLERTLTDNIAAAGREIPTLPTQQSLLEGLAVEELASLHNRSSDKMLVPYSPCVDAVAVDDEPTLGFLSCSRFVRQSPMVHWTHVGALSQTSWGGGGCDVPLPMDDETEDVTIVFHPLEGGCGMMGYDVADDDNGGVLPVGNSVVNQREDVVLLVAPFVPEEPAGTVATPLRPSTDPRRKLSFLPVRALCRFLAAYAWPSTTKTEDWEKSVTTASTQSFGSKRPRGRHARWNGSNPRQPTYERHEVVKRAKGDGSLGFEVIDRRGQEQHQRDDDKGGTMKSVSSTPLPFPPSLHLENVDCPTNITGVPDGPTIPGVPDHSFQQQNDHPDSPKEDVAHCPQSGSIEVSSPSINHPNTSSRSQEINKADTAKANADQTKIRSKRTPTDKTKTTSQSVPFVLFGGITLRRNNPCKNGTSMTTTSKMSRTSRRRRGKKERQDETTTVTSIGSSSLSAAGQPDSCIIVVRTS